MLLEPDLQKLFKLRSSKAAEAKDGSFVEALSVACAVTINASSSSREQVLYRWAIH